MSAVDVLVINHKQSVLLLLLIVAISGGREVEARFASRFSLSAGEEYNDNIFFAESKEHDFVTSIIPTLNFAYQPFSQAPSTFTADLSAAAQFFARHSDLNNFGDDLFLRTRYIYLYSPRLVFDFRDSLERRGQGRVGGFGGFGGFGGTGGSASGLGGFGASGSPGGLPTSPSARRRLGPAGELDLVSRGETLDNDFSADGSFLYSPNVTLGAHLDWDYTAFFDEGGREIIYGGAVSAAYRWRQQHNLFVRYGARLIKSRDGSDNVVHDVDVGDDYLTTREIRLTPTLTVFGSTGLALQTGDGDFRVRHRLNIALMKLWRTATFSAGVSRRLTGSLGVAGPSYTTSFFSLFNLQLTQRLVGVAGIDFSLFDARGADFKTLQTLAGFAYWFTPWLAVSLTYNYRWLDPENGAEFTEFLRRNTTDSNSVFFLVSAQFDVWPNVGFAGGGYFLPTLSSTP